MAQSHCVCHQSSEHPAVRTPLKIHVCKVSKATRRAHSEAASQSAPNISSAHATEGRKKAPATNAGSNTATVRIRSFSTLRLETLSQRLRILRLGQLHLLAGPAESAFAVLKRRYRPVECRCVEIRPQGIGEMEFGIGQLP